MFTFKENRVLSEELIADRSLQEKGYQVLMGALPEDKNINGRDLTDSTPYDWFVIMIKSPGTENFKDSKRGDTMPPGVYRLDSQDLNEVKTWFEQKKGELLNG